MNKEEFKENILRNALELKKKTSWRLGQSVFNYVDSEFGSVARYVQFNKHVDCFYDDYMIDDFINEVFNVIENHECD